MTMSVILMLFTVSRVIAFPTFDYLSDELKAANELSSNCAVAAYNDCTEEPINRLMELILSPDNQETFTPELIKDLRQQCIDIGKCIKQFDCEEDYEEDYLEACHKFDILDSPLASCLMNVLQLK
ncbi:unnamed protein product [Caenorhabditis bovis]|uniref:DUF19 domain-containing protein n=1 Tax=Caenorhabditis bovis TaxID=2654633 RepID=A0A8S1EV43_9PELO|nr:unnamed protein product [Caenorhabditis bovis]